MNQKIVKYLQENKEQYSKESLVKQLERTGYDAMEINNAVAIVYETELATNASSAKKGMSFDKIIRIMGVIFLVLVVGIIIGNIAIGSGKETWSLVAMGILIYITNGFFGLFVSKYVYIKKIWLKVAFMVLYGGLFVVSFFLAIALALYPPEGSFQDAMVEFVLGIIMPLAFIYALFFIIVSISIIIGKNNIKKLFGMMFMIVGLPMVVLIGFVAFLGFLDNSGARERVRLEDEVNVNGKQCLEFQDKLNIQGIEFVVDSEIFTSVENDSGIGGFQGCEYLMYRYHEKKKNPSHSVSVAMRKYADIEENEVCALQNMKQTNLITSSGRGLVCYRARNQGMYIKFFPKDGLVGRVGYYIDDILDKEESESEEYLKEVLDELSDIADQFSQK